MRLDRFIDRGHTFRPLADKADTAERITQTQDTALHRSDKHPRTGCVGTVFGDVFCHNSYGTRFRGSQRERIEDVERGAPELAWAEAVQEHLGALED
jgi:hypothetical protein